MRVTIGLLRNFDFICADCKKPFSTTITKRICFVYCPFCNATYFSQTEIDSTRDLNNVKESDYGKTYISGAL